MANYERHSSGLPMIVKFVEHFHNGVQSHTLSRYAIGYIVRGEKHIYNGDKRQTISKGDVFFLGIGTHYTEEVPDESNTFEQILFYYQPADLHKILMYLNLTYGLNISYNHACPECQGANAVSTPAWQLLKGFFQQYGQLPPRRRVPPRRNGGKHQDDRTGLPDRLARRMLSAQQDPRQHRHGEGEFRTTDVRPHFRRYFDRRTGRALQPVAHFVQRRSSNGCS